MASPWSPVGSLEDEEQVEEVVAAGDGAANSLQQQLEVQHEQQQEQNEAAEASAHRRRGKRPRSGDSSSVKPPTSRKSKVWQDFEIISPEGAEEVIAECLHCHRKLKADSRNGTSSLARHHRSFHPTVRAEIGNYFLQSEKNDVGSLALKNYKVDVGSVRTGIYMFIIGGAHPFTIVEEHGFKNMMSLACPQYPHFSRHTSSRDIMGMFEKERLNVIESLSNSPGRVSFTSDNWKSDCQKYNYICITAHYIDAQWKLRKRIIWFNKLTPPLDGASIADEVHMCFREWKVDNKIMCMTLDNASYNDSMIRALKTRLLPKGVLPLWGTFFQVRCCAHILNLIVKDGLALIDASVDKLIDGIQYINASSTRMHKFYDAAVKVFMLEAKTKLHVDMPVRWNSTYKMIDTACYFQEVFDDFPERDNTFKLNFMPTHEEWKKLDAMNKFLKTFYDATCIFSWTKYPTSNLYFRSVFMVHSRLIESLTAPNNFMTPMVKNMKVKFDKYWSDYSTILSCAAILDPRYKLDFLSYCYTKIYGDDGQRRVDEVRQTMQTLFEGYRGSIIYSDADPNTSNQTSGATRGGDMFSDYGQFLSARRTHEEK